jgi:UDP-N-acetylmuramate dehydrogenase
MTIRENFSLKPYNTFGVEAAAKWFSKANSIQDVDSLLAHATNQKLQVLVLGGGSNMLLCRDFDGLVIKIAIPGIEHGQEDEEGVLLNVGSGVIWHELVMYCVANGYGGIENLSLIPGLCGAAPMQNIGAYGVEIKNVLTKVTAWDRQGAQLREFTNEECRFGYRESVFKNELRDRFVITGIQIRLTKQPRLNTSYGAIEQELERLHKSSPTIEDVSQAVINIRQSKLPNPAVIGNAGSFFKNPIVDEDQASKLAESYEGIPLYAANPGFKKLAAGWLIEKAGWKGLNRKTHGVHDKQALVLVNYGEANGTDIYGLSEEIMKDVFQKFGVQLEREVNIV